MTQKKGRTTGILAATASAFFLGLNPIFGKQALLNGFSPLSLVTLRTGIAVLLLIVFMLIRNRQFFYIYPVGLIGCILAGFLNGVGSILYYSALSRLDTSIGHLIYSFYPLFLVLWQLLDSQTPSKLTFFRLALSIPGIYLLVSTSQNHIDSLGVLLMLGSAMLYALHLLVNQRVLYEVPAQTVTCYTLLSMTATVSIAYLVFDRTLPAAPTPWWPVFGMAVITFLSRITLFTGVKHLGGMQTAILGLSEIFVTVGLAQIWLGERMTNLQWIGAVLLGISLLLIGLDKHVPEKKYGSSGWLSWINPPRSKENSFPWQANP